MSFSVPCRVAPFERVKWRHTGWSKKGRKNYYNELILKSRGMFVSFSSVFFYFLFNFWQIFEKLETRKKRKKGTLILKIRFNNKFVSLCNRVCIVTCLGLLIIQLYDEHHVQLIINHRKGCLRNYTIPNNGFSPRIVRHPCFSPLLPRPNLS